MNQAGRHYVRPWILLVAAVALIASPIVLYMVLPLAGVSASVVSGVALMMLIKHLGVLAALLGPLYALLRRRLRH